MARQRDLELQIGVKFRSKKKCESIINALVPDNVKIPDGLYVRVSNKGSRGLISVSAGGNARCSSLTNTVDELLEHISVAISVVEK